MTRTMQPCGTEIAYQRHIRLKQSACFDCHQAHNAYRAEQRAAVKYLRELDESLGRLMQIRRKDLRSKRYQEWSEQRTVQALDEQVEANKAAVELLLTEAERVICQHNLKVYVVNPQHLIGEITRGRWDWVRRQGRGTW